MGEDKSLLNSNVERLSRELEASGCGRIIIMCGDESRVDLFTGECHIDTKDTLAESLFELVSVIQGSIQQHRVMLTLLMKSYSQKFESTKWMTKEKAAIISQI